MILPAMYGLLLLTIVTALALEVDNDLQPRYLASGSFGVCGAPQKVATQTIKLALAALPNLLMTPFAKRGVEPTVDDQPGYNKTHLFRAATFYELLHNEDFVDTINHTLNVFADLGKSTIAPSYGLLNGGEDLQFDEVRVTAWTGKSALYPVSNCWVGNSQSPKATFKFKSQLQSAGGFTGLVDWLLGGMALICNLTIGVHLEHATGMRMLAITLVGGSHTCQLALNDSTVTRLFAYMHTYEVEYMRRSLFYSRRWEQWRLGRWHQYTLVVFGENDDATALLHCVTADSNGHIWGTNTVADICAQDPITVRLPDM